MTSTLCIVLAHGAVQETFDRHWDLWVRHGFDMVVGCPVDDPLECSVERVFLGKSSYAGEHSVVRLKNLLRYVADCSHENAIIFEYDSMCLIDKPVVKPGFHGILQANEDPWHYTVPRYINAPWTIDAESAWSMLMLSEKYPDFTEGGQDDRFLSALAWFSGIPPIGHAEGGFARNGITSSDWPLMIDTVEKGGKWIHGVKHQDTLELLRQAWKGA